VRVWLFLPIIVLLAACSDPESPPADAGIAQADAQTGPADRELSDVLLGDAGIAADGGDAATEPADTGMTANPDATISFTPTAIDEARYHAQGVRTVDLDLDGDRDVIVAWSTTPDAIYLYANNGDGLSFTEKSISGDDALVALHTAIGDLDQDGDLDVAAVALYDRAEGLMSPGKLIWYENPGDVMGAWVSHVVVEDLYGLCFVEAGDLTGDGRLDLVVSGLNVNSGMSSGVRWFRNTGGDFAGPFDINPFITRGEEIVVADVDRDNVLDVIVSDKNTNGVAWFESSRVDGEVDDLPTFTGHAIGSPSAPTGFAFANFDDDVELELVVAANDRLHIYSPPADPREVWQPETIDVQFGLNGSNRVAAGDFNQDGRLDFAVSGQIAAEVRVYLNTGSSDWLPVPVVTAWSGVRWVAAGDLDGDLRDDVVTTTYGNTPSADKVTWWRSTR
jgi:hypothetical protein